MNKQITKCAVVIATAGALALGAVIPVVGQSGVVELSGCQRIGSIRGERCSISR